MTMTLPCSIRITHRSAKLAFPFVRRGLVPEAASSFFLPKLVGHSRAMHLLMTGDTVLGEDRLVDGLFSEVLETAEEVLPRACEIAGRMAIENSAVSMYLTKNMLWHTPATPEETHLLDSRLIAERFLGR